MSTPVFIAVLCAALLHAVWNSVVKGSADKHAMMLAVTLGHVPIALLALSFAPPIDTAALPWIIGSVVLHLGYQLFLIAGYRAGDLTLVYPIARGSAPVTVMVVSIAILGVSFSRMEIAGVAFIVIGLISLALVRRENGVRNPRAVAMALCTGGFIAAYSLVDGIGARLGSSALGYWSWAAIGNALGLGGWMMMRRPRTFAVLKSNREVVVLGLMGGTASFIAYGLVIWAFTQAPIALVTALREASIVFALLIGVGVLKERLDLVKVASTLVTIFGAIVLRASKP
ncbi:DMT family transporter [Octadecabacter sp. G9-8]|uniref:DMT family transporter n=1 Tax=Octadecabacter dasysiphoniae TaxID=2909341 RepID=A0ABS9CUY0_9RHOB|nr:DMT family transporter [Octadecabacter dasysiphoniae]MCF2870746.1 DMT family transporter [Octadecabacter dasysiphoniae]